MEIKEANFKESIPILDVLEEAISVIDTRGYMIYVNAATCVMDGLPREKFIGRHLKDIYNYTEDVYRSSTGLRVLETGKPLLNVNTEWFSSSGKKSVGIISSYPMVDENGKMVGVFSVTQNMEQMREVLKKSRQRESNLIKKGILQNGTSYIFEDIYFECDAMRNAIAAARNYSEKDISVMIYGETGTGKEMFAQGIHNYSSSMKGPFVAVNCAAIPESLMESILFGTVKGAFTGASDREGLFEKAKGGTIFLDEINSMPLALQAKILRVLQENEVQRIGDSKVHKIFCRVLSAANKHPLDAVECGELRSDLYYRLSEGVVEIPPLRKRGFDLNLLVYHFINRCNIKMGLDIVAISPEMEMVLRRHLWPGNVRELYNVILTAMNMVTEGDTVLDVHHIPEYIKQQLHYDEVYRISVAEDLHKKTEKRNEGIIGLHEKMAAYERSYICDVLKETRGNISYSSRLLGISRQALCEKLKKYDIDIRSYREIKIDV